MQIFTYMHTFFSHESKSYLITSRALPGFPGHLQHWLKIRGGNTIQKYFYNPNFIPIGQ